jgi:replicative DNA helicase
MVLNSLNQYGHGFQIKVLSSLLKHKEFLQNIHDAIEKDYFDSPSGQWIVAEVLRYYYKYNTVPTLDSLQAEVKKIDNEVLRVSVIENLKESLKASNEDRDYVEQEFNNFCRNQQIKKAILNSVSLLENGKYEEIELIIKNALKSGQDKSIGHEYDRDVESRFRQDVRKVVPTPWPNVNELLAGGLGVGDLGLIFGNPGGGKSWMLVNLGAMAVKAGMTVAHYTLELSEDYVGKRYDAIFTGIDVRDIHMHRAEVEEAVSKLPGKLIIREFSMGKASPHAIENHYNKCKNMGIVPDLIIIDYVDLLKPVHRSKERKDELDDLYASIKGMARELKVPIWTVSQVNRAGAKDDVIEGDKAAGSYNKLMIADFAMSLSRKRMDKVNGTGRIHIMKNRYGGDGMTYSATVNTACGFIDVSNSQMNDDDLTFDDGNSQPKQQIGGFSSDERKYLAQKFFELSTK